MRDGYGTKFFGHLNLLWATMKRNGKLNHDKDNSQPGLGTMGGGMVSNLLKAV
jgi:hypothetical protein